MDLEEKSEVLKVSSALLLYTVSTFHVLFFYSGTAGAILAAKSDVLKVSSALLL